MDATSTIENANSPAAMPAEGVSRLLAAQLAETGITTGNAEVFKNMTLEPPDWILKDMISNGMKCDLIGKSKTRKTFMSLQLCICIAKGVDFLGCEVPRPRKTAYINLELMDYFLQERIISQDEGLPSEVHGLVNLELMRIRGKGRLLREQAKLVIEYLESLGTEFVLIDPQYKLLSADEDENSGAGMQGILEFRDALAEHFAVMLVAHDTKGEVGHKAITDRGAGTGFLGRDYDFRIVLTPHADGMDEHIVVSVSNRNRKTPPDFTAVFDGGTRLFARDDSISPVMANPQATRLVFDKSNKKTVTNAEREGFKTDVLEIVAAAGVNLLGKESLSVKIDESDSGGLSVRNKHKWLNWLIECGDLCEQRELEVKEDGSVGKKSRGKTFVSTPELVEAYRAGFATKAEPEDEAAESDFTELAQSLQSVHD